MFITIKDEGGIANLVVLPTVFESFRQVALGSRMLGVLGRVQKQGEVIHLMAERLEDLSGLLASAGARDQPSHKPRDIYMRDLRLDSGIRVPARDSR
jgi:error-prone DNA polymerase